MNVFGTIDRTVDGHKVVVTADLTKDTDPKEAKEVMADMANLCAKYGNNDSAHNITEGAKYVADLKKPEDVGSSGN